MPELKRMTAIKTTIKDIVNGLYLEQEGFAPNYVLTSDGRRLSRVRILATVVSHFISEDQKFAAIKLDDATDTIDARIFGGISLFENLQEGDIIDLIGKVRQYKGDNYIIAESVYKTSPNWEILRALEIKKQKQDWDKIRNKILELQKQVSDVEELKSIASKENINPEIVEDIIMAIEQVPQTADTDNKLQSEILELIKQLDDGKGAKYAEIVAKSSRNEDIVSSVVNDLLVDGLCYEPKPGIIKCL
jgi:RPA family protein